MRYFTLFLTLALTLTLVGCGGDSHEQAADDLVVLTQEVGTIFEGVEDKETAEQAKEKLIAKAEEFRAVGQRLKDLGEPKEDMEDELKKKYGQQLDDIAEKMSDEILRIMQIDSSLMTTIQEGMDAISAALEEAEPKWVK